MKHRIRVLPETEHDIDSIYAWIAKRSIDGAARWYRRLLEVLKSLEHNPEGWGLAPEHRAVNREIRQVTFKTRRGRTYRALFEIRDEEVVVLHIRGPGQRLLRSGEVRKL